ncbi:hypothetical protein [Bradyrhizobium sp. RDM4]|uniref:DUF7220 family protein n=1 Tax=Bradyrhizobium sp. RDM4 TaxID=3378765 RepID=UPI0038FC14A1
MKQSKLMSLAESVINILVGFGISLAAQVFFLPMLGVAVSFRQNLLFALIMTVISIARSFLLRRVFEALHIRRPLSPFMQAVVAERARQVEGEGWSTEHDDAHRAGELALAGASYAKTAHVHLLDGPGLLSWAERRPDFWPWSGDWWKPAGFRRDLVRAGALIIAEGEKFDRRRGRK